MKQAASTLVLALVLVTAAPAVGVYQGGDGERAGEEREDRYVLRLTSEPTEALHEDLEKIGLDVELSQGDPLNATAVRGTEAEVAEARDHPKVRQTARDRQHRIAAFDDPLASEQWEIDATGLTALYTSQTNQDFAPGLGTPDQPCDPPHSRDDECIVVAVLDTGVDFSHPELSERQWDTQLDLASPSDHRPDPNGHGTHVAGAVAATTDNSEGIASLAGNNQTWLDSIQVCGASGSCWGSTIAVGIASATDRGADIVSMSIGGPVPSGLIRDAVAYAQDQGTLVVAAAGNDYANPVEYPAGHAGVIGVTATEEAGGIVFFSNEGSAADLAAPGHLTISSVPTYDDWTLKSAIEDGVLGWQFYGSEEIYASLSGTSMSTPQVSGAAALAWAMLTSRDCTLDAGCEDWRSGTLGRSVALLLEHAAEDRGPAGWDPSFGWGVIRADAIAQALFQEPFPRPVADDGATAVSPDVRQRSDASGHGHRQEVSTGPGPIQVHVGHRYADVPLVEHRPVDAVEVSVRVDPARMALLASDGPAVHPDAVFRASAMAQEHEDQDPAQHTHCALSRFSAYSDTARTGFAAGGEVCGLVGDDGTVAGAAFAGGSVIARPLVLPDACSLASVPDEAQACNRSSLAHRLAGAPPFVYAQGPRDSCASALAYVGETPVHARSPDCPGFVNETIGQLAEQIRPDVSQALTDLYGYRDDLRDAFPALPEPPAG